jgi:uncharacterized LabA/DUF88 family protein
MSYYNTNDWGIIMDSLQLLNNVAIYIDYENVYKTLASQEKNLLREGFFEKIQNWCRAKKMRIIKIVAYCNFDNSDMHESYHQTMLQEYGVLTVHTSNRGKNYADMQISIDAINDMYLNQNIDQFIIMSNDKDMSPLLNTIKSNKRKVILLTVGSSYDFALCNVPDEHIPIEEILKEKIDKLYIEKTYPKILENIEDYYSNQSPITKQLELGYCISNQMTFRHIMKYELLNIFHILQSDDKLFIYEYEFRGKPYYGIAVSSMREDLISMDFIKREKIVHYDFETKVKELYKNIS